jgi:hypothetical protein
MKTVFSITIRDHLMLLPSLINADFICLTGLILDLLCTSDGNDG